MGAGEDRRGGAGVQPAGQQVHHCQLQPADSTEVGQRLRGSPLSSKYDFTEITPS